MGAALLDHMDIARALATVELLCSRDLTGEHGRPALGPGHATVVLATSEEFWDADAAEWLEAEEQFEAYRDGLSERLADRWGRPHLVGLAGLFERTLRDEEIPEPWNTLASHVPDLHLWHLPDRGHWLALGVSQWDKELPFELLAVLTAAAPP